MRGIEINIDQIQRMWERTSSLYTCCRVRAIILKNDENRLYSLMIDFLNDSKISDLKMEYQGITLLRKVLSVNEGKQLIDSLINNQLIILDDFEFHYEFKSYNISYEHLPKFNRSYDIGWPYFQIYGKQITPSSVPYRIASFLDKNLPYFRDIDSAIREWFEISAPYGNVDSYVGLMKDAFRIIIPLYELTVKKIMIGTNKIKLNFIALDNTFVGKYICKYEFEDDLGNNRNSIIINNPQIEIPINGNLTAITIIIMDQDAILIDWYELYPHDFYQENKLIEFEFDDSSYELYIQNGENQQIEFKKDLPSNDIKLMKTISAFANTEGGIIFLGVDDEGKIIGFDRPKIEDSLSDKIRNTCDPPIEIDIHRFELKGIPLIAIIVPNGKNKPYLVKGTPYIRHGATSREITRIELNELFTKQ